VARVRSLVLARPTISVERVSLFCNLASWVTLQAMELHCIVGYKIAVSKAKVFPHLDARVREVLQNQKTLHDLPKSLFLRIKTQTKDLFYMFECHKNSRDEFSDYQSILYLVGFLKLQLFFQITVSHAEFHVLRGPRLQHSGTPLLSAVLT
jgi:hypothetical protein